MATSRWKCLHVARRSTLWGVRRCAETALDLVAAAAQRADRCATSEGNPLPRERVVCVHCTAADGRIIIVGDVHGCADELHALLDRCHYRRGRDVIVCAGDVVNKGPRSVDVVRFLRGEGALAVRGNHDEAALAYATGIKRVSTKSQWAWTARLNADDRAWLRELPFAIVLPQHDVVVVHAGVVPGVALEEQCLRNFITMRSLSVRNAAQRDGRARYYADEAPASTGSWANAWEGPEHIVFGHDARAGLQRYEHATGIDSACVYGHELSALLLPGHDVVSVAAARNYARDATDSG